MYPQPEYDFISGQTLDRERSQLGTDTVPNTEDDDAIEPEDVVVMPEIMNQSSVKEFIFLGFSSDAELQLLLFALFLPIYLCTVLGNILISLVITMDPVLHTPMYFFLRILSLLEICYISVTIPKMLETLRSSTKSIYFESCGIQMFIFVSLRTAECFLLAGMAFDCYVATCDPLHYTTVIMMKVCAQLSAGALCIGGVFSLGQTCVMFTLPYCGPNRINQLFSDVLPLLKLVCTDIHANLIAIYTAGVLVVFMPFVLVVTTYTYIIAAILRIPSAVGRRKAFSTCASHLLSVNLVYGTGTFAYVLPKSGHWLDSDKLLALFYAAVLPMLNPMIYSLRNKEVKGAVKKLLSRPKV
ncbi:olfactory receptor 10C1-like [Ambystoma mexicanum]|uniref:olfactory receptor 10C1-like n=1 Tax=Ambystoma mexicanum TaxID=8296 RepID=UPI0037E881DE